MRFLHLTMILLLLVPGAMGADAKDANVGPNDLRDNPNLTTYSETESGQARFVEGRLADNIALGEEIQATHKFLREHRGAFRINSPEEQLEVRRIDVDELGMRHVRLTQKHQGLEVIGGEMISHITAGGVLKTVNGKFYDGIDLDVTPGIQSPTATGVALADLESFFGTGDPDSPELVVFPWEERNHLAWRLFIYSSTPMGRWEYLVDAKTGDIIFKANRIMDVAAIGTGTGVLGDTRDHIDTDSNGTTFRMIDNTRQVTSDPHGHGGQMPLGNIIQTYEATTSLPGFIANDADNTWTASNQAASVDGHVYTALVYDYLNHVLGRNGYDDNGSNMYTSVNYSAEGDNNAYWNGSQIVIWSFSSGWRSLAACPDVIAHEWGHAVTETASNLQYQKESGALNESFSDMIGAAFEFAHPSMDTPDWDMGENGIISGSSGFRSMSDPHSKGDPDTYGTSDPYWIDVVGCSPEYANDYCGVHTNSGVGNKWFYLLSDGGTHNSVSVTGIDVANAMQIAYR
ncbi:MAG: peptidase M4 family protein, partial [bacterium]|nr:peptidase M4 family protein [bacterium]